MPGARSPEPEYVAARRVLLDAFEALGKHRKAIVLVGAQAIYLHVGDGDLAVAPYTTDGDLAIDPGGTAANFREQMLNTFEGQKQLLSRGSRHRRRRALRAGLQAARHHGRAGGERHPQRLSRVARAREARLCGVRGGRRRCRRDGRAVIAAKAGIALLVIGLKAAGITIGGLMATILPAVLIFGALALAVARLRHRLSEQPRRRRRLRFAFRGLVQLFEQGGFSGAVRDELNRAENAGLKTFLIRVYQIAYRIQRFFQGIGDGFSAGIEAARPVFEAFVGALRRLGEALGLVSSDAADAAAGIPSGPVNATTARSRLPQCWRPTLGMTTVGTATTS